MMTRGGVEEVEVVVEKKEDEMKDGVDVCLLIIVKL